MLAVALGAMSSEPQVEKCAPSLHSHSLAVNSIASTSALSPRRSYLAGPSIAMQALNQKQAAQTGRPLGKVRAPQASR